MASKEYNVESAMILCLKAQSAFTSIDVLHHEDDPRNEKDRIVVKAEPRTVAVPGISEAHDPKVYWTQVTVTGHLATRLAATIDTWNAAIVAAFTGTPAATAATFVLANFTTGIQILESTDGDRTADGTQLRLIEKRYRVRFDA